MIRRNHERVRTIIANIGVAMIAAGAIKMIFSGPAEPEAVGILLFGIYLAVMAATEVDP